MKKIISYSVLIALTGYIGFISCKKEKIVSLLNNTALSPPALLLTKDTLKGKEFVFEELSWVHAGPGGIAEEEVWIGVENRSDLFNNPANQMEVSISLILLPRG